MAALERVTQLKQQGTPDSQIITSLKQEGISPKEIYEALSQYKIKSAVDSPPQTTGNEMTNMKPSIMVSENVSKKSKENYPQEQYMDEREQPTYDDEGFQTYEQPESYQEGYYQEYQPPQQQTDIETINDIAEQIVEEKTNELKKQISSFKNFREEIKFEVEKINERVQKLESNFNDLQMAILKKIGEYGQDIKNISEEMHATQDSFSKILNPLTDNLRELQKITGTQPKKEPDKKESTKENQEEDSEERKKPGKPKPGFENYLR